MKSRLFLTVSMIALCQLVFAQKVNEYLHIQDSIYSVQSNNLKKYIRKGNRANFTPRKHIVFVDFGSALTLSINGGYTRKLNESWAIGVYIGYTKRYSKYELFVNNSASFPLVNLRNRGNAFNSANGSFIPLLDSKYTMGKTIGLEFNYFKNGKCFNGSAFKFGYRYKDNGIRYNQLGGAIDANTFISYSFSSISNLSIRQNQFYAGLSWQTLVNNHAFFEFSVNGGMNLILYSKKMISMYEKFGVDQLDGFSSISDNMDLKPSLIIKSGKQVYVPSNEGKYPVQIRPFVMFNVRMGLPF
jgi:hypothetical protein